MIGAKTMIRSMGGRLFTMCAVSMSVAVVTISPSLSAPDFGAADALMLRLMSTYNVSGAALALIKDGGIVLEKGYGYRDRETDAPVTTATLFNIGSISKSFTALGIAQLVDQHQVDLDIRKYRAKRSGNRRDVAAPEAERRQNSQVTGNHPSPLGQHVGDLSNISEHSLGMLRQQPPFIRQGQPPAGPVDKPHPKALLQQPQPLRDG